MGEHYTVEATRVLCTGYAVEVLLTRGDARLRVISVYLPPTVQQDTWDRIRAVLPPPDDIPTYVAGDFNLQLFQPREGEDEVAELIRTDLFRLGCVFMPFGGATRLGRGGPSQLDFIAAPRSDLARMQVRRTWRHGQSDHASMQLCPAPASGTRTIPAITPQVFKHLPAQALSHLRRGFATLELHYEVPLVDLSGLRSRPRVSSLAAPVSARTPQLRLP